MTDDRIPPRSGEHGFTMIELAIVLLVAGVLMAIATSAMLRARMSGNEAAAIANLKTINTGQLAYFSGCGRGYYATSLTRLGARVGGGEGYISASLATGPTVVHSGYTFSIAEGAAGDAPADCNGQPAQAAYYASAVPTVLDSSGSRSFATSQGGDIWGLTGGTPPAQPFGPPAVQAH